MAVPILDLLATSLQSIGVMMTMVSAGIVLARIGFLDGKGQKLLSAISMKATIPALLFTTVIYCDQCSSQKEYCHKCKPLIEVIASGWVLLPYPLLVVCLGIAIGRVAALVSSCPRNFSRGCVAACAFGNSTGLPIVLLSVLRDALRVQGGPLAHAEPLLYLSVYLMFYPLLQWSIGGFLLRPRRCAGVALAADPLGGQAGGLLAEGAESREFQGAPASSPASRLRECLERGRRAAEVVLVPPVVASLLGLLVGLTPLRGLLVDTVDQDGDAPLEWLFDALRRLGDAAVPINLLVLGGSLARGPDWAALPPKTGLAIVLGKLLVMPAAAALFIYGSLRTVSIGHREDKMVLCLVALLVTATPTANNVQVMANVAGQSPEAMGTAIFVQYVVAPVVLTGWLVLFLYLIQSDWYIPHDIYPPPYPGPNAPQTTLLA